MNAVAYVVFQHGDRVLLQQRTGTGYLDGYWATGAAGHVEAGESVHHAACREALEELGVDLQPEDLTPLTVLHRAPDRVDFFFRCPSWSKAPRLMEPGKTAALRWFPLDELPVPMVPHELYVFQWLHGDLPCVISLGDFTA